MKLNSLVLVALAVLMTTSCKVRITVPEGGSVVAQSGAYSCASGKTCDIDVVDFYFDQTFVAKPATGYTFKFWNKGDRRLCGGKSRFKPCRIATAGFTGDWIEVIQPFLENPNEIFYLEPEFNSLEDDLFAVASGYYSSQDSYLAKYKFDGSGNIRIEFTHNIGLYRFDDAEYVGNQLYAVSGDGLFKINTSNSSVQFVSNATTSISLWGPVNVSWGGTLASYNGALYTWLDLLAGYGINGLYRINLNTGLMSQVFASDYRAIALTFSDNGELLALGKDPFISSSPVPYLAAFNLKTGSRRDIGSLGLSTVYSITDIAMTARGLIAFKNSVNSGSALYLVDQNTGKASLLGSLITYSSDPRVRLQGIFKNIN